MRLFKRKSSEGLKLHKVTIQYEALVMAKNDIHAVNLVREFRNAVYENVTVKFIGKFSIHETHAKARKL